MAELVAASLRTLSPRWLVGPILDKELRVSSRRRRNYVIRAVYLGLLTLFAILILMSTTRYGGSVASRTAAMARAGLEVTTLIAGFQFLVCQVLAVVMLSTAISDEVCHKTLGVLMTTPINSLQIVVGKLFSRLLQVLLLMAMSLPLLAIVRVFGGIAWGYLAGVWVLTLTTTLFVGSMSLLYSIFCRRAYVVILWTLFTLGFLWLGIPVLAMLIGVEYHFITSRQWEGFFTLTHPFVAFVQLTEWLASPRGPRMGLYWACLSPSLLMLAGAIVLLAVAVIRVRVVARRQITGEAAAPTRRVRRKAAEAGKAGPVAASSIVVRGCPVLWKELRAPLLGRRRWVKVLGLLLVLAALAVIYGIAADENALRDHEFHMCMLFIYMVMGGLYAMVFPATTVTSEKEARSWPILLGTTLGDWRIIWAKGLGAIRRSLPAWAFFGAHVTIFTMTGVIHPLAMVQLALAAAGLVAFMTGTGLYFSSRFRHTTTAVIANLAVPVVLWILVPIVLGIAIEIVRGGSRVDHFLEIYFSVCPFTQALAIAEQTARDWTLRPYHFAGHSLDAGEATVYVLITTTGYALVGLMFAWVAKGELRKRIF